MLRARWMATCCQAGSRFARACVAAPACLRLCQNASNQHQQVLHPANSAPERAQALARSAKPASRLRRQLARSAAPAASAGSPLLLSGSLLASRRAAVAPRAKQQHRRPLQGGYQMTPGTGSRRRCSSLLHRSRSRRRSHQMHRLQRAHRCRCRCPWRRRRPNCRRSRCSFLQPDISAAWRQQLRCLPRFGRAQCSACSASRLLGPGSQAIAFWCQTAQPSWALGPLAWLPAGPNLCCHRPCSRRRRRGPDSPCRTFPVASRRTISSVGWRALQAASAGLRLHSSAAAAAAPARGPAAGGATAPARARLAALVVPAAAAQAGTLGAAEVAEARAAAGPAAAVMAGAAVAAVAVVAGVHIAAGAAALPGAAVATHANAVADGLGPSPAPVPTPAPAPAPALHGGGAGLAYHWAMGRCPSQAPPRCLCGCPRCCAWPASPAPSPGGCPSTPACCCRRWTTCAASGTACRALASRSTTCATFWRCLGLQRSRWSEMAPGFTGCALAELALKYLPPPPLPAHWPGCSPLALPSPPAKHTQHCHPTELCPMECHPCCQLCVHGDLLLLLTLC